MIKLREEVKIYVSLQTIDARKNIDGLCALVHDYFTDNPQSGNLFIFFNKARDKVKMLWWDANGFVLHYKRLEKGRFVLPKLSSVEKLELSQTQLYGLLAGLDFSLMRHFPEINYYHYA
jgi:transposase